MQRIERFPAEEIKTQISPPCQAGIKKGVTPPRFPGEMVVLHLKFQTVNRKCIFFVFSRPICFIVKTGIFPHALEKDEQLSTIFIVERNKSDEHIDIVYHARNIIYNSMQQLNSAK